MLNIRDLNANIKLISIALIILLFIPFVLPGDKISTRINPVLDDWYKVEPWEIEV